MLVVGMLGYIFVLKGDDVFLDECTSLVYVYFIMYNPSMGYFGLKLVYYGQFTNLTR